MNFVSENLKSFQAENKFNNKQGKKFYKHQTKPKEQ